MPSELTEPRRIASETVSRFWLACLVVVFAQLAQAQIYGYFKDDPATTLPAGDYTAYLANVVPVAAVGGVTVIMHWNAYDNGSDTGPSFLTAKANTLAGHLNTAAGGKTVNFIIVAASGGIGSGGNNVDTPAWVFDQAWANFCCSPAGAVDVCYCNSYQGTVANGWTNSTVGSNCYNQGNFHTLTGLTWDHSGVPAAWEAPFVAAYQQWLAQFFSWAKTKVPTLGYVRVGVGTGGGSVVACPNVEEGAFSGQMHAAVTKLTEPVWLAYNQAIYSSAASDVSGSGIMLEASMFGGETFGGGDGMIPIGWADDVASAAVSNGFGLGAESLSVASDIGDNVLSAGGSPCSNDWCALFSQYRTASVLGLQTLSQSDPNCLGAPSTCNQTSSLLTALPFGTQRRANVFEVYYQDLLCAYDSGYTNSTTPPNNGACEAVSAGRQYYPTALSNAASGQPTSAGIVGGAAKASGPTTIR